MGKSIDMGGFLQRKVNDEGLRKAFPRRAV
jgi:hypothetical protein